MLAVDLNRKAGLFLLVTLWNGLERLDPECLGEVTNWFVTGGRATAPKWVQTKAISVEEFISDPEGAITKLRDAASTMVRVLSERPWS